MDTLKKSMIRGFYVIDIYIENRAISDMWEIRLNYVKKIISDIILSYS